MFRIFLGRVSAMLAVTMMLLLVSGCGGGSGGTSSEAGIGSGGTGLGVTTGFGSLIVDGMRYNDAQASYMSEEDQGPAKAMASTGAMLGHSLEFGYDASGAMMSVMISPELVGNVSAVATSDITVLGTKVNFNNDTALGPVTGLLGYASLAAVQVGDRVAVYGLIKTDASGTSYVQATLIVQKPTATGIRLSGYVSQYDATAGSFTIGSNTVNIGSATVVPAGTSLSNGELVTVWSNATPVGNVIAASNIRIKWPVASSGNLTLSGSISSYIGAASFKVRNVTVDASTATIAPAGTTLGDGKYLIVVGKFDAATNKLVATSVTVYAPAAANAIELHGTVLNFVSASSFTVRGVVVDASTASFSGATAAQLANGAFLEVTGALVNNVVRATTVNILALNPTQAPMGATLDMPGTITSYNTTTGAYTLTMSSGLTVSGQMGPSMFYNNGTATNFAVGQSVNVRGMMSGSTLSTSVVSFTQSAPATGTGTAPGTTSGTGTVYMEGIAYNVTASSFMLNGLTIQTNGVAVQGGSMMGGGGMMSGSHLGVDVQYSAGQYVATAITLL